mmetsp:Transcript_5426/g.13639  ORF Transcript_5426/g.13639 Transcript_5426/m.13639 type:complete len:138 (-) Transcript_5426:205-618(-)|eukprot:CAMPEP_0197179578 /NCGR_PEP_ID=MMETSP1423-20130617/4476_1 /TAXON_ID=476441 /ORGANISM="Pseudo-nitzschia heimii, Strain UNC1101" /LENGTH=137 /DNA_ID=CAMNT_0042629501 /DNA_START=62 /DNA_END=475 /DNA_ORIENTATION=-
MAGNDTGGRRRRSLSKKDNDKSPVKKGRGGGRGNRRGSNAKRSGGSNEKGRNQRKKGNDDRGNGKGATKGKKKVEKKEPLTAEQLDASMDDYWQKSKDKSVVSKKLDDDMDDYWGKKEEKIEEVSSADKVDTKEDEN